MTRAAAARIFLSFSLFGLGACITPATRSGTALSLSPSVATLATGNTLQFTAQGGTPPYSYAVVSSASAGDVNSFGVYVAPNTPTLDSLVVTDATGATVSAEITVNVELTMTPAAVSLRTGESVTLAPSGGASPYTYLLLSGGGALTVDGIFTPPWAADSSVVEVSDAVGNRATVEYTRAPGALQAGTSASEVVAGGATDADGNLYVAGSTNGALVAGGARGNYDVFVRKYDPHGTVLWTRQFGSTAFDYAAGVALDTSGNVYVVGETHGAFDGNSSLGSIDAFVYSCDTAGAKRFSTQFGTATNDHARSVAVDSVNGAVYVAGYTHGALSGANLGGSDLFIRRYSTSGTHAWTTQSGTAFWDEATAIAVDPSGFPYLTGYVGPNGSGAGSFNGVAYPQDETPAFVVKYSSAGAALWTVLPNNAAQHPYRGKAIVADRSGYLYVTFADYGALFAGNYGVALAKLATHDGATVWTVEPSENYSGDYPSDLSIDASNNAVLVSTKTNYDPVSQYEFTQGTIAKFGASTGAEIWAKTIGGLFSTTIGTGSATSGDGNAHFFFGFTNDGLGGFASAGELDLVIDKYDSTGDQQ